jgi:hypothetical protein
MKKLYSLFQLLCCLMFLTQLTHAQTVRTDTAFIKESAAKARSAYTSAVRSQSHLYNGSQYIDYNQQENEHPFHLSDDWMTGWIEYDGEHYENVSILYDIAADKVIIEHFAGAFIELITTKVTAFGIKGHLFRKISKGDDSRGLIAEGFYEILYDKKTKAVARYEKQFEETIVSLELKRDFSEKSRYYIIRNNTFYPANSKRAILQIFSDKKKEIRRFIRDNGIDFKTRAVAIVRIAEFYDKLNP